MIVKMFTVSTNLLLSQSISDRSHCCKSIFLGSQALLRTDFKSSSVSLIFYSEGPFVSVWNCSCVFMLSNDSDNFTMPPNILVNPKSFFPLPPPFLHARLIYLNFKQLCFPLSHPSQIIPMFTVGNTYK